MRRNRLGRTDIEVSALCLGTMTWGEQNTEAEGHEQMDYALDQGINLAPAQFEAGFMSIAHSKEDLDKTIAAVEKALTAV